MQIIKNKKLVMILYVHGCRFSANRPFVSVIDLTKVAATATNIILYHWCFVFNVFWFTVNHITCCTLLL